jgi:hypothetical protein
VRDPVPFLPRLRCSKCKNTKPPSLAIATQVYWIYPEWRAKGAEVVITAESGEVNLSGGRGITYYLMCRRIVCGAITPLPDSFRVKLV